MSTHNICFHGEIRKIVSGYPHESLCLVALGKWNFVKGT